MAARSIWSGQLGFGPISTPVKIYKAQDDKGVDLKLAHEGCGGAVGQKRECKVCEREIGWTETDRAFELSKDERVILTKADLAALPLKSSKKIEITGFLNPEDQPDPIYYGTSYYIAAEEAGETPFALIIGAMAESKLMGLAKITMRQREKTALIRALPDGRVLLTLLFWGDEIRDDGAFHMNESAVQSLTDRDIELSRQLVQGMVVDEYDPTESRDPYKEALLEVIKAKIEGREVTPIESESAQPTGSLTSMLEAAVAEVSK
jgi:DNA end-binding protein Ku